MKRLKSVRRSTIKKGPTVEERRIMARLEKTPSYRGSNGEVMI
jgi:hypothetical protein